MKCTCCGKKKKIISRGLCNACYQKHRSAGTLDNFRKTRVESVSHNPENRRVCECADCGCEKKIHARALCNACYLKHKRAETMDQFQKTKVENVEHNPYNQKVCQCLNCGQKKKNAGRGLCGACYEKHRVAGTLDKFQKIRPSHCVDCGSDKMYGNDRCKNCYQKHRRQTDPLFKLQERLRTATSRAFKHKVKDKRTLELLGCTLEEAFIHLESQFQDGMSWDNYGKYGWHIDHIKPIASFDLTDPEQIKKACHYTNLQPLWASENLSKSSKHGGKRHYYNK